MGSKSVPQKLTAVEGSNVEEPSGWICSRCKLVCKLTDWPKQPGRMWVCRVKGATSRFTDPSAATVTGPKSEAVVKSKTTGMIPNDGSQIWSPEVWLGGIGARNFSFPVSPSRASTCASLQISPTKTSGQPTADSTM